MKNTAKNKNYKVALKDMLFPVEIVATPYAESNPDCAFDVVATINGIQRKLQSCSDVYQLITNAEIFPTIEASLKSNNVPFESIYTHTNYSKFYAQYNLFTETFKVGNLNLSLIISVIHSYDGWLTYSFFAGLVGSDKPEFRKSIPVVSQDFFKGGKHTKKALTANVDFFETVEQITTQKDAIKKALETLVNTKVEKPSELVEKVMKATKISEGHGKEGKNKTAVLERALSAKNLWDVYNAFNEGYIYNNDLNRLTPDKRAQLDLNVMNYLLN
jgi:hypothetical protein